MNSIIMPCLTYHDAGKMIDWLCDAFGFQRHAVYEDDAGGIMHAELTLGSGMIMLGSEKTHGDDAFGRAQSSPSRLGGTTQSPYIVVADADEAYRRAKAAGAEMVLDIETKDYGRGFTCRDPEGHLWSLGDYNPWQSK